MAKPELRELIGDYGSFIAEVNEGLNRLCIPLGELAMCDHICYRVETSQRYDEMLVNLAQHADLLGESHVNGRLIATFELPEPIVTGGWTIPYIELPQPKPGSAYEEGLEHAEFVTVGSLVYFESRHSDIPFDHKGMTKAINPELGLKHEGISVKFHELQLGAVVRIEQVAEQ